METFIQDITKEAGDAVMKKFGKIGVKYTKTNITDVVSEADLISNRIIIKAIKKKYPNHGIISEETGESNTNAEYVWIIDPLDGTRNFVTGTPLFAVMIGLARNGKIELATVYNPCTNEFLYAKKGEGAFCNNKKVHCSEQKTLKGSWGVGSVRMSKSYVKLFSKILKQSKKQPCWVNGFGCFGVDTIYLATGRRDWRFSKNASIWDYAAPSLILSESGHVVTNFKGKEWSLKDNECVIANKHLHPKLLKILESK